MRNSAKPILMLLGFIFLFLALASSVNGQANFKKAGEEVLFQKEKILQEKAQKIEGFVDKMSEDSFISLREMAILSKMLKDFKKIKKESDEELIFFNLKTSTEINPQYQN